MLFSFNPFYVQLWRNFLYQTTLIFETGLTSKYYLSKWKLTVCIQGRPEALAVMLLKIQVFWHITKCHRAITCQLSEGSKHLHLQVRQSWQHYIPEDLKSLLLHVFKQMPLLHIWHYAIKRGASNLQSLAFQCIQITRGHISKGTAVTQWLRCCVTNRKVAGSIPAGVIGIFHWHKILLIALRPSGVDSASNRNEYQEHFPGVKAAGA